MNRVMKQFIEYIVTGIVIVLITTVHLYNFNPFPYMQPNYNYLPIYTTPLYENVMVYNTSKTCITTWKPILINQNTELYNYIK